MRREVLSKGSNSSDNTRRHRPRYAQQMHLHDLCNERNGEFLCLKTVDCVQFNVHWGHAVFELLQFNTCKQMGSHFSVFFFIIIFTFLLSPLVVHTQCEDQLFFSFKNNISKRSKNNNDARYPN